MVFIPIRDINKRIWVRYQFVTLAIVVGCSAVTYWQLNLPPHAADDIWFGLGFVPAAVFGGEVPATQELTLVPLAATPVTSLFLHGGWLHLIGNMMFLWVFGDNVEDSMGHARFLAFFLLCGVAGAIAHGLSDPASETPLVGASGAISGILGAYVVLHPRVRVWVLFMSAIPMRLPTWLVIGGWIGLNAAYAVYGDDSQTGIAWWAHVGGFAAGVLAIPFFKLDHVPLFDMSVGTAKTPAGPRAGKNRP